MEMNIIILEDQADAARRLTSQLKDWGEQNNCQTNTYVYSSGEAYFHQEYHMTFTAHVFFLDIQLGTLSGIDVAKRLRAEGYQGYIIFLTAFREYVFHGYEVHALNYLLKPVQPEPLFLCLNEIAESLSCNSYFYRSKQSIVQIPYRDILCFCSCLHYVDILTVSQSYRQYSALNHIISYLPQEFIRTHRSYVVNMTHIYRICKNEITLSNQMTVQIGRSYINQVAEAFANYSVRLERKGTTL